MVVRTRMKKARKYRGMRAQGYGNHKRHRGSGSIGGSGQSGLHKHKWSTTLKEDPEHFGKHGFVRPRSNTRITAAINVEDLQKLAGDSRKIDLSEMGFQKVIGAGSIDTALEVTAESFSKHAREKIEAAGGKVFEINEEEAASVSELDGHAKAGVEDAAKEAKIKKPKLPLGENKGKGRAAAEAAKKAKKV
jgi:large subunit ribosomal protein L15